MKYIDAFFEDGVFRPTEPVDLEPGTRVILELLQASQPATLSSKTPDQLSELEREILYAVHSVDRTLERILESLNWRREDKGTQELTREQVEAALRSLIDAGYVQEVSADETSDTYRVTPKGKVTQIHRSRSHWASRKGRPEPALPPLEDIGPFFEDLDLSLIDLSHRAHNVLSANGIRTVGDVLRLGEKGLRQLRGFGKKSIEEIEYHLDTMGLRLRDSKSVWATLGT